MKSRHGFVSNSSSSSFIISTMAKKPVDVHATHSTTMDGLIKHVIDTEQRLAEVFVEEYDWGENLSLADLFEKQPYLKESYDKCALALRSGQQIMWGHVDTDDFDNPIEVEIFNEGLGKTLKGNFTVVEDNIS